MLSCQEKHHVFVGHPSTLPMYCFADLLISYETK